MQLTKAHMDKVATYNCVSRFLVALDGKKTCILFL